MNSIDLDLDVMNRICDAETYEQLLEVSKSLIEMISRTACGRFTAETPK